VVEAHEHDRLQPLRQNAATVFPRRVILNSNAIRSLGDAAMSDIDIRNNDLREDHSERKFLLALLCTVAAEISAFVWWLC
jgi:hypothetical protein